MYRSQYNYLFNEKHIPSKIKKNDVKTNKKNLKSSDNDISDEHQPPTNCTLNECVCKLDNRVKTHVYDEHEHCNEHEHCKYFYLYPHEEVSQDRSRTNDDLPNQFKNTNDDKTLECPDGFICFPKNSYKNRSTTYYQLRCFKCKKICPPKVSDELNARFSFYSHKMRRNNSYIDGKNDRIHENVEESKLCKNCGKRESDCLTANKKCICTNNDHHETSNCVSYKKNFRNAFKEITCFGACNNTMREKVIRSNLESVKNCMKNRPVQQIRCKVSQHEKDEPSDVGCSNDRTVKEDISCSKNCGCIVDPKEELDLEDKGRNKKCFNEIIGTPCSSNSLIIKHPMESEQKIYKQNRLASEPEILNDQYDVQLKIGCNQQSCQCGHTRNGKHCFNSCTPKPDDGIFNNQHPTSNENPIFSPQLTKKDFWQYSDGNSINNIPYGIKLKDKSGKCNCCCCPGGNDGLEVWKRIDELHEKDKYPTVSNNYKNRNLSYKLSELLFKKYDEFCCKVVKCISRQFTFTSMNFCEQNTCKCFCCKRANSNELSKQISKKIDVSEKIVKSEDSLVQNGDEGVCKYSGSLNDIENFNKGSCKCSKTIHKYPVQISCGKCIIKTTENKCSCENEKVTPPEKYDEKLISSIIYEDYKLNSYENQNNPKFKNSHEEFHGYLEDLINKCGKSFSEEERKHIVCKCSRNTETKFLYPQLPEINDLESNNRRVSDLNGPEGNNFCMCHKSSSETSSSSSVNLNKCDLCDCTFVKPAQKSPFWKKYFKKKK